MFLMLTDPSTVDEDWPPKDPSTRLMPEEDPNYVFKLPDSPWTYANGTLNPALHAGRSASSSTTTASAPTSARRRRNGKANQDPSVSNVPPYHPDYGKPVEPDSGSDTSGDSASDEDVGDDVPGLGQVDDGYEYSQTSSGLLQRRGSEGYEVRPIDRQALLLQHVQETTSEPGRYNWYVPTREDLESSSEEEDLDLDDDERPLGVNGEANTARA